MEIIVLVKVLIIKMKSVVLLYIVVDLFLGILNGFEVVYWIRE